VREATTLAAGARRVAAGFAATGGVARGADLIEQQLLGAVLPRGPLAPGRCGASRGVR